MENSPQTHPQTHQHQPISDASPRSTIGIALRGAAGLAITGAIIGGLLSAALLGGMAAFPSVTGGLAQTIVQAAPIVKGLADAGTAISAGSAALAGLGIGAAGGAVLGAPAGMVAAPIYMKQKVVELENAQLKAAMPMVAEQAAHSAIANIMSHAQEAEQQAAHQFNNPHAKVGHVDALSAQRSQEPTKEASLA